MQDFDIMARIEALCRSRSWSYYRLAKESGIPYSTLCTMFHKSNCPSLPTLVKLCNCLGITLSQFFDMTDDSALLSADDKKHLALWSRLSDKNKSAATTYIEFLLSEQS